MTLVLKLQITEPFSKLEILALLLSPSPPLLNSQPTVINFLSVVPICIRWETFFFLRISHLHLNICQTFRATYFINDFQLLKKKVSFICFSLITAIVRLFTFSTLAFYSHQKCNGQSARMVFFTRVSFGNGEGNYLSQVSPFFGE